MLRPSASLVVIAAAACLSCSSMPTGADASVEGDDAGVTVSPGADAGATSDAGAPSDAGATSASDAGATTGPDAGTGTTDGGAAPVLAGVTNPQDVIDAVNARLPVDLRIAFLGVPTGRNLDAERARRGPRVTSLTRVTEISTTGPNQVVRSVDADRLGTIHAGTIIIDSRIRDGSVITVANVILAHVEITDPAAGNLLVTRDGSDGLIVVNSWFHDSDADCFRPNDNETYLGNFVEKLGRGPTSHADAFQTFFTDGTATVENVDVLANIIWMPRGESVPGGGEYQTNRAMLFSNDVVDWVVAYNYLVAGNYVVERDSTDDIRYLNNVFCLPADCQAFGIRTGGPWTAQNWAGNTYTDGSPAPAN